MPSPLSSDEEVAVMLDFLKSKEEPLPQLLDTTAVEEGMGVIINGHSITMHTLEACRLEKILAERIASGNVDEEAIEKTRAYIAWARGLEKFFLDRLKRG